MLVEKIESMIKDRFGLEIPVFLILQEELNEFLQNAPDWWGDENKEIYDNLIFMIPPLSYEALYNEIGSPKAEYEKVSDKITIRTAGTVRKIVEM